MIEGGEAWNRDSGPEASGERPQRWRFSSRLWDLSAKLNPSSVNKLLKVRSAKSMPDTLKSRFKAMLIPEETIDRALSEVHRLDDWVGAWSRAAQRFMAESRREEATGEWEASSVARRNAAMCYHAAHLVTEDDPRIVRALRASAVQAFGQAITRLAPGTRRVGIPWRTRRLPAYLSIPIDLTEPAPLVVMLNGATTTKEETFIWTALLRERGFAILAVDWPGTGEAADGQPLSSYCDDMTEGIFDLIEAEPDLDATKVAFFGASLGGVVAFRSAASDRRIAAVVALTPPFDPRPWVNSINPLVARQLVSLAGQAPSIQVLISDFSLPDVVSRVRCPALVFGAARDLVVPPDESVKLTSALGALGTLVWYPDGSHCLFDRVDDWMLVTAEWLTNLFELPAEEAAEQPAPEHDSTQVDSRSAPVETGVAPPTAAAIVENEPAESRPSDPVDSPENDDETGPDEGHQS
jgi:alpha-beta hydrolase superfamily lysophospholipase